jgi:hypothetical protein
MTGFSCLPLFMIGYELAVAQTLPKGIGEALSCGMINVTCNLFGFLSIMGFTPYLNKNTRENVLGSILMMATILLVGVGLMIFVSFKYKKTETKPIDLIYGDKGTYDEV